MWNWSKGEAFVQHDEHTLLIFVTCHMCHRSTNQTIHRKQGTAEVC